VIESRIVCIEGLCRRFCVCAALFVEEQKLCNPHGVRLGVVLILLSLVAATPVEAHTRGAHWPVAKTMRTIEGVRVRVLSKVVRIDTETTLCSGRGRATRRQGVRTWTHFDCTFTTFRRGLPGRDLEFRVHALDSRRIAITSPRWIIG
jgi:hypothetical protein